MIWIYIPIRAFYYSDYALRTASHKLLQTLVTIVGGKKLENLFLQFNFLFICTPHLIQDFTLTKNEPKKKKKSSLWLQTKI